MAPDIIGQMKDLGYDTHNSLFNLGTCAIFSFIYIFRFFILSLIWIISKLEPRLNKTVQDLKNELIFGEFIVIGIEAYFEFLISGYLAYHAGIMTTNGEVLSTALGWFVLNLALFLMPLTLIYLLN
jgi:hypothetical protein